MGNKEITVDLKNLETNIQQLKELQVRITKRHESWKQSFDTREFAGDTHDALNLIGGHTNAKRESIEMLITNTIKYLEGAKTEFSDKDTTVAKSISE